MIPPCFLIRDRKKKNGYSLLPPPTYIQYASEAKFKGTTCICTSNYIYTTRKCAFSTFQMVGAAYSYCPDGRTKPDNELHTDIFQNVHNIWKSSKNAKKCSKLNSHSYSNINFMQNYITARPHRTSHDQSTTHRHISVHTHNKNFLPISISHLFSFY